MKALVLAGGGAKGSFQVGVLEQLAMERFDMVIGCSAGALNAAGYAHLGVSGLLNIWKGIKSRADIFSLAYSTKGILSSDPLRKIIKEALLQPARCSVWVNRVCLEDGQVVYARPKDADYEDCIVASCSLPGVVVPVKIGGKTYVDGGVLENCPLRRPVDLGADEITIILCNPMIEKAWKDDGGLMPLIHYAARAFDLACHEMLMDDLNDLISKNKNPEKRQIKIRIFSPEIEPMGTLQFEPELIRQAILMGNMAKPTLID